jgi:hypothetical protein
MLMAVSCEKGLDPINSVPAQPDMDGPELQITFPIEGKTVVSPDEPATVTFKLLATDDAELGSVVLELNGTVIANITSFLDYRRLDLKYNYAGMTAGDYTLKAIVTDLVGNSVDQSVSFNKVTAPVYEPMDGEVLYFPLDGFYLDLVTGSELTVNGTPAFAEGKVNDCYQGATDAYLTYPAASLTTANEFSVCFWYKINAEPQRGGIMAISPVGDSRNFGLRMFRENSGDLQNIGLNFGDGTAEVWMNPFVQVPVDQDWIHIAVTISMEKAVIYVDGIIAPLNAEVETTGIDWTGCDGLSIASGMPNFVYWDHKSDLSLYDEIHFFKKGLTAAEVLSIYEAGK